MPHEYTYLTEFPLTRLYVTYAHGVYWYRQHLTWRIRCVGAVCTYVACNKVTYDCNMFVRCAFPIRLGSAWEYYNNKQLYTYCIYVYITACRTCVCYLTTQYVTSSTTIVIVIHHSSYTGIAQYTPMLYAFIIIHIF